MRGYNPFFDAAGRDAKPETLKDRAGHLVRAALDLFWPPVCSICPRALPLAADYMDPVAYFCPQCLKTMEFMPETICPVCGRPFFQAAGHVCGDCLAEPPPYSRARAAAIYQGGVSRAISLLKYGREMHQLRALTALAGPALISALPLAASGSESAGSGYDLIVPMPVSDRRLAERGFNQAAALARAIYGPFWSHLIDERALVRARDGDAHQAALNRRRRRKAIRGCFQAPNKALVKNARILLFDDVLTTGATAGEAAATLLKAGARRVDLATIARAVLESWR